MLSCFHLLAFILRQSFLCCCQLFSLAKLIRHLFSIFLHHVSQLSLHVLYSL